MHLEFFAVCILLETGACLSDVPVCLAHIMQVGALGDAPPAKHVLQTRQSSSGGPALTPFMQQLYDQTATLLAAAQGASGRGLKRPYDADEGGSLRCTCIRALTRRPCIASMFLHKASLRQAHG